jgi:hypothetical protein
MAARIFRMLCERRTKCHSCSSISLIAACPVPRLFYSSSCWGPPRPWPPRSVSSLRSVSNAFTTMSLAARRPLRRLVVAALSIRRKLGRQAVRALRFASLRPMELNASTMTCRRVSARPRQHAERASLGVAEYTTSRTLAQDVENLQDAWGVRRWAGRNLFD